MNSQELAKNFINEFDRDPKLIYLNSGTHALCPRSVLQAQASYQKKYESNPSSGLFQVWGQLWSVQKKLAANLGANPEDLFLRSNVTHPLNEFILSMKLPTGSEIVTTAHDYGAVLNICRARAEKDGLSLKVLPMPLVAEMRSMRSQDWVDFFIRGVTEKTSLFVGYHIYSGHGLTLPIEALGKELQKRGIRFVVDGAHTPGIMPLNFSTMNHVDYYAGNLHKWWLGPKGTAFGWVPKKNQVQVHPLMAGWPSFDSFEPFSDFAEGHRFAQKMMLLGCLDFSPFLAIADCLEFWKKYGADSINEIRQMNLMFLRKEMQEKFPGEPVLFASADLHGPMQTWTLPEKFRSLSFRKLMDDILLRTSVQVALTAMAGEVYLRLAPHIYNHAEEMRTAVAKLSAYFSEAPKI